MATTRTWIGGGGNNANTKKDWVDSLVSPVFQRQETLLSHLQASLP